MIRTRVRSTGERGIGLFLLTSLSLHGFLLVAVMFHRKPVSLGYQTATTVSLVSEDLLKNQAPATQPNPVVPKPKVKKVPPPKPAPPKPMIHHKPALKAISRPPVPKFRERIESKHLKKTQLSRQKVVHPRKPLMKKVPAPPVKKIKEIQRVAKVMPSSVSKPLPVVMDVAGERFPSYLQHLLISRIKSNWAPPPGSHGLQVKLHFVLKKDGSLESEPVLKASSGSKVFDTAALYAILRSVPFPPFPPSYGREKEDVTVTLQATKRQGF